MTSFRFFRILLMTTLVVPLLAPAALAQRSGAPVDEALVGGQVHMHMLLEKTIFQVDVMRLDVWLGEEVSSRIEYLLTEHDRSNWLEDTVAAIARDSRDARVEVEFVRDVSLNQFVDGIRDELEKVHEADLITKAEYEDISSGLPTWFSFLEERGIRDGDRLAYRIRGDTLRTRFVTFDGMQLLDQVDVGAANRLAVMGSYFVRGSSFRDKLVRSLFGDGMSEGTG